MTWARQKTGTSPFGAPPLWAFRAWVFQSRSFQVDRAAAVRLVQPALFGSDDAQTLPALAAVTRIGGDAARQALERFVELNATNSARNAFVSEAQRNLRALKK